MLIFVFLQWLWTIFLILILLLCFIEGHKFISFFFYNCRVFTLFK